MQELVRQQLLALNQQFYQKNAHSFAATRKAPWPGWQKLLPYVREMPSPLNVIDIGCGNGRLGDFMNKELTQTIHYTGIDESAKLLNDAERQLRRVKALRLLHQSVEDGFHGVKHTSFEIVALLAVIHHIPTMAARLKLLTEATKLLTKQGLLIVSFWQFMQVPRIARKALDLTKEKGMTQAGLATPADKGDFLLPWQNSALYRYCHHFTDEEIDRLVSQTSLIKRADYVADGATGRADRYLILKKP